METLRKLSACSAIFIIYFSGCKPKNVDVGQMPYEASKNIEKEFISGDLARAELDGKSAYKKYHADPLWSVRFRNQLANTYLYAGKSADAVQILRQNSVNTSAELELERELILAVAEARLGHHQLSDQALTLAQGARQTPVLYSQLLEVQGGKALSRGKIDEAEHLFLLSLQVDDGEQAKFHKSQTLINLGVVKLYSSRYDEALNYFYEASMMAKDIGARLVQEKALSNISWTYYLAGDFALSLQTAKDAEAIASKIGAVLDQTQLLINAGKSEFRLNELRKAESFLNHSLILADSLNSVDEKLHAHVALAYLLLKSRPEAALPHIIEASKLAVQQPDGTELLEPLLLKSLLCIDQNQISAAEANLLTLVEQSSAVSSFQWEAANTLAGLFDKTNRPQLAEHWYERAIDTYHQQRLTLKSVELELPFLENGSDLYMGYMEHLIRAGRTGKALRLLDTSRAETLAEGLGTASVSPGKAADPRAVAGRLGATILVYCLRPERSYLWAITGKEQQFYTLPGSGAILPLVARHDEAIAGSKDLLTQKDAAGRALYDALLAPAARLLPKDGGRVVLVADSVLSRLNFETLIAPGDPAKGVSPHYWIEDVSVTNARSLRLLAAGGRPHRTQPKVASDAPKMLLIGDPIYAKGEYAPLPHAGAEMAEIAAHFADAERVVAAREEASPAIYEKSRPGRFRFLHFVAHATASELNPLDSAVILTSKGSDNGAGASNKLYASEILKQPLSAELVTLSSCYSSGTRNYAGEGVVGLAWAFLRAGAHSVIGALWDVSDVSTPKLMDTMYTRLLAGDAPDAALRAAKLEMLHSDGVFRKPVYWGAFQLYAGR